MPIQLIAFMVAMFSLALMTAVFSLACIATATWVFLTAFSVEGSPMRRFLAALGGFVVCCVLWYLGVLAGTCSGYLFGDLLRLVTQWH